MPWYTIIGLGGVVGGMGMRPRWDSRRILLHFWGFCNLIFLFELYRGRRGKSLKWEDVFFLSLEICSEGIMYFGTRRMILLCLWCFMITTNHLYVNDFAYSTLSFYFSIQIQVKEEGGFHSSFLSICIRLLNSPHFPHRHQAWWLTV